MKKIEWKWEWPHWIVLIFLTVHYILLGRFNIDPSCEENAEAYLSNLPETTDVIQLNIDFFLVLVVFAYLMYAFLLVFPTIDPYRKTYTTSKKVFNSIRFSVLALITGLYVIFQYDIIESEFSAGKAVLVFIGIVLMMIGNQMGKIRPNWFIGIPTPWTLTSRLAWQKTNRLGGWLITIQGIVLIPFSWFSTAFGVIYLLVTTCGTFLTLFFYSYVIHSADENKEPTFTAK